MASEVRSLSFDVTMKHTPTLLNTHADACPVVPVDRVGDLLGGRSGPKCLIGSIVVKSDDFVARLRDAAILQEAQEYTTENSRPQGEHHSWHDRIIPTRSSKGADHDFATVTRRVAEQAMGEKMDGSPLDDPNKGTNPAAVALGKLGGREGR